MAIRILKDYDQGYQCLYNSTTEQVFGHIYHIDYDLEDALEYLGDNGYLSLKEIDARVYNLYLESLDQ